MKIMKLVSISLIYFTLLYYVSGSGSGDTSGDGNCTCQPIISTATVTITSGIMPSSNGTCPTNTVSNGNNEFSTTSSFQPISTSLVSTTKYIMPTSNNGLCTMGTCYPLGTMASPIETSSSDDGISAVLKDLQDQWMGLVIGLVVGVLLGCCMCSPLLICLCCYRKKKGAYSIEQPAGKKYHVRFEEKPTVRVEEIPLESAETDKNDFTEPTSSNGSGERVEDPTDTKDNKLGNNNVAIVVTDESEGESAKEHQKEVEVIKNLEKESPTGKTSQDQPPSTDKDQPPSTDKDQPPSTAKDQPPSTAKDQPPATEKGQPPSTTKDQPLSTASDSKQVKEPSDKQAAPSEVLQAETPLPNDKEKHTTEKSAATLVSSEMAKEKAQSPTTDVTTKVLATDDGKKIISDASDSEREKNKHQDASKQENVSITKGTTSEASESEKPSKEETTLPDETDDVDALLQEVLKW